MIQSINLTNYKAFEKARIPLKPITILLGANSVGKSSIIQLLLMLQQTGKAGLKSYKSPLKLYGGYVNLGDAKNLFRNKNTENPLSINFEFKSSFLEQYLKEELLNQFVSSFSDLPYYLPIKGFSDLRSKKSITSSNFETYVDTILTTLNKEQTLDRYKHEINWIIRTRYNFNFPNLVPENKKQLLDTYKLLDKISNFILGSTFDIKYEFIYNNEDNLLKISMIELRQNNKSILKLVVNDKKLAKISSDLFSIENEINDDISKYFDSGNTIFNTFNEEHNLTENGIKVPTTIIIKLFQFVQNEIKKEFGEESINYVSPLRAHPKRYYMLDKAKLNLTLDTLDGDAIAEVIKDDEKIQKKVNTWFKKFGIQINVQEFKEVIHHLKVNQNGLDLDITDVGFGISQVLPVIIQGFLSSNNTTTIIEQPEIHLHPKIQADLADLFIDIVKNPSGKRLIIETHSEYILKRLRRRISEGKISPNNVSICIIEPQTTKRGAVIKELKIEDKGFFDWPKDFYAGDLYDDITKFLKNQQ